jgi:hypothetical protein
MKVVNTSQLQLQANIPILGDVDQAGHVISPRADSFIVQVQDNSCLFHRFLALHSVKSQQRYVNPLLKSSLFYYKHKWPALRINLMS